MDSEEKEIKNKIRKDIVKTLKNHKKFNKKYNCLYSGNQLIDELLLIFDDEEFYK